MSFLASGHPSGLLNVVWTDPPPLYGREVHEDVGERVSLEGLWSTVDNAGTFVEHNFPGLRQSNRMRSTREGGVVLIVLIEPTQQRPSIQSSTVRE